MSVTAADDLKQHIAVQPSKSMAIADQALSVQDLVDLEKVSNAEQASRRMMQYLAVFEQQMQGREQVLGLAEQLQQRYAHDDMIRALWQRLVRFSEWQKIGTIVGSAGLRFVDSRGWQPTSPELRIRKALLTETSDEEHIVSSNQGLILFISNLHARALQVEARLDEVAFLPQNPLQFYFQIDDRQAEKLIINRHEDWHKLQLQIPSGTHQLRFFLANPISNQFLKLRFHDSVAEMVATHEKAFFVSQKDSPLQFYVQGPAQIRIDEWRDDKIQSRLQDVAAGWQMLSIPPGPGQQESLLQIRQRKITDKPKSVSNRMIHRQLTAVALPKYHIEETKLPQTIEIEDVFSLGGQEDGTWSVRTETVRRNNLQEDFAQSDPEHFQQFKMTHRYQDAYRGWFWRTEGFVRLREHGEPSFGFKESLLIRPGNWPVNFNFETSAISQEIDDEQEWAGQLKMTVSQTAQLFPKTSITPKLSWFGRYLSLRDSEKVEKDGPLKESNLIPDLDQNIYTSYKAQHTSGMSAALQFSHSPWLDTRWQASIKTASNENMNIFNPDYFSTEMHWLQLLGNVSVDASYRVNFFRKTKTGTLVQCGNLPGWN